MTRDSMDEHADELATRLLTKIREWQALPAGTRLEDSCPFCGALVLVRNNAGDSDLRHALPACELWLLGLASIGAHSPRVTDRHGGS